MTMFGVRIVKEGTHMGKQMEFGNTYHIFAAPGAPFNDAGVATYITNREKDITGSDVKFIRYETWGPTDGTEFDNVMRERAPLSGNGLAVANAGMYGEVCVVIAWPLPRSPVTNRRRWCRKFIRRPGTGLGGIPGDVLAGRAAIAEPHLGAFRQYGQDLKQFVANAVAYELRTETGVPITGDALVRPYMLTREIGR